MRFASFLCVALFAVGCGETGEMLERCATVAECDEGEACINGFCTPRDRVDAGRDSGAVDAGERPDASEAPDASEELDACVPSCGLRECGADGCGGLCGECETGEACSEGRCQPEGADAGVDASRDACMPTCDGFRCGPDSDGCGGECTCPGGLTCTAGRFCDIPSDGGGGADAGRDSGPGDTCPRVNGRYNVCDTLGPCEPVCYAGETTVSTPGPSCLLQLDSADSAGYALAGLGTMDPETGEIDFSDLFASRGGSPVRSCTTGQFDDRTGSIEIFCGRACGFELTPTF